MASETSTNGSGESGIIDGGVAPAGGIVCQNEPEHDGGGEVKMRGGPFEGQMCPECGRHFLLEADISYSDPPHDGTNEHNTESAQ